MKSTKIGHVVQTTDKTDIKKCHRRHKLKHTNTETLINTEDLKVQMNADGSEHVGKIKYNTNN